MSESYHISDPIATKVCSKCHVEKPITEFYKQQAARYKASCKTCFLARQKERKREKLLENPIQQSLFFKVCTCCHEEKFIEDFALQTTRNSVQSQCKKCLSEKARQNALKRKYDPLPPALSKSCTKCQQVKPLDQFNVGAGKYGRSSQCKDCLNTWHYQRYSQTHIRQPKPINGGKICTRCHAEKPLDQFYPEKRGSMGRHAECIICLRERKKRERQANPTVYRDQAKRYRASRPDQTKKIGRKSTLKSKFGISPEEYQTFLDDQLGVCAICKQPETVIDSKTGLVKRLSIDHDHKTGRVRRLLCGKCNSALGLFKDSPDILSAAILYLQQHEE